jgi:uncharacterized protein YegJ (DUF2314 family)
LFIGVFAATQAAACSRTSGKRVLNSQDDDKVISVAGDDAEMTAAIEKARATLPVFWKAFEQQPKGVSGFALKVKIEDANGAEHFWANKIEKKDSKIFGVINNEPNTVKSVTFGQRVAVMDEQITDWLFMRNDKMVSNYTLRPLMKRMPKDQADLLRAKLEDP